MLDIVSGAYFFIGGLYYYMCHGVLELVQGCLWLMKLRNNVNVDIFACMHFRRFMKMGIFAWIKICVLRINGSLGYHKSICYGVNTFVDIKEMRITRKYVQRVNLRAAALGHMVGPRQPPLCFLNYNY